MMMVYRFHDSLFMKTQQLYFHLQKQSKYSLLDGNRPKCSTDKVGPTCEEISSITDMSKTTCLSGMVLPGYWGHFLLVNRYWKCMIKFVVLAPNNILKWKSPQLSSVFIAHWFGLIRKHVIAISPPKLKFLHQKVQKNIMITSVFRVCWILF